MKFILLGWLLLTFAVLLAPAVAPCANDSPPAGGISKIKNSSSALVIRAAKDGPVWHVVLFLGLGALAALLPASMATALKPSFLFVALIIVSLIIEFAQETMIPGRAFEWSDVSFNAIGNALGLIPIATLRIRHARLTGHRSRIRLF